MELTEKERIEIAEILTRRSNEIAGFKNDFSLDAGKDNKPFMPGSVALALTREMERLRKLADKLKPQSKEDEEE